ncbi:hypothetical protein V6N13_038151 [Hibiscus sabdariffa]|uniref:Uncharacterized protein n=1 Tax=Hibiscus sabdariffa TaxID=183260 RepID=A0ABR2S3R6_9ROSI
MNTVLFNLRIVTITLGIVAIVLVIIVWVHFCLIIPINNRAIERRRRRQASYPVVGVMQSRTHNGDLENQLSSDQAVDHIVQREPSQNQHDKTSRSAANGGEIESCCTADEDEDESSGPRNLQRAATVTDIEDESRGEVMYIKDESTGEIRPIRFFTPPRIIPTQRDRNIPRVARISFIEDKSTGGIEMHVEQL